MIPTRVSHACRGAATNSGRLPLCLTVDCEAINERGNGGIPVCRVPAAGVEHFKNLCRADLERDVHAQTPACVFVQNSQHLVGTTVAQLVVDDVHTPHMVRVRRPHADDGAVFVIEPFALPVPVRQLQTLLLPEALYLLVVHRPVFDTQLTCRLQTPPAGMSLAGVLKEDIAAEEETFSGRDQHAVH